jgi:predicted YcjX-like family ATPase
MRVPRFRPPLLMPDAGGRMPPLPEIGLGAALNFLLGDRLA